MRARFLAGPWCPLAALAVLLWAPRVCAQDATLEQVVQRMGQYVAAYGERAALIVATENYTQRVTNIETDRSFPPRQMLAEFAIVKVPGQVGWIGFRDVVQFNGQAVTDRRDRLMELLSNEKGDADEARRITNESARFNIGPVKRNFSVPTSTLYFFHPSNLSRFKFRDKGTKSIEGVEARALEFKESVRPTLVMTAQGHDVPCEGTVWVLPADGTIVRTLVMFRGFADDRVQVQDRRTASTSEVTRGSFSSFSSSSASSQGTGSTSTGSSSGGTSSGSGSSGQGKSGSSSSSSSSSSGKSTGTVGGWERGEAVGQGLTAQQVMAGNQGMRKLESLARIEVTFRQQADLGMWLPSRMSELYEGAMPAGNNRPPFMGQATGVADYGNFRQFRTSAKIITP